MKRLDASSSNNHFVSLLLGEHYRRNSNSQSSYPYSAFWYFSERASRKHCPVNRESSSSGQQLILKYHEFEKVPSGVGLENVSFGIIEKIYFYFVWNMRVCETIISIFRF